MSQPKTEAIEFQVHFADVRDYVGDPKERWSHENKKRRARRCTVLLKGRTADGKSVLLRVKGFRPWFFVVDHVNAINPRQLNGTGPDNGTTYLRELNVKMPSWNRKYDIDYSVERRRLVDGCEPNPADDGATVLRRLVYRILCPTIASRKSAVEKLSHRFLAEESSDCKALVQFYAWINGRPNMWIRINRVTRRYPTGTLSWASDHELRCEIEDITVLDKDDMSPLRILVMDIETNSIDGRFPKPEIDGNKILIVGTRQMILGQTNREEKGIQFVLNGTPPDPDNRFEIRSFPNESSVLTSYADYVKNEFDPDVIVTWNGRGFDNNYLSVRATKCGPSVDELFHTFSVLRHDTCRLYVKKGQSKQSGARESFMWRNLFGRLDLDLMLSVKQEVTKYRSYTLNFISEELLGEQKVDLSPQKLWENHKNAPGRLENAIYCDKDCLLPLRIMDKLKTMETLMQLSNVCYTEMDDIISQGQTRKVWNLIHAYSHLYGFVVNHLDIPQPDGYQGAYVLDPILGWHNLPINVLDFKSLYPSLMMEHNLCYSSQCHTVQSKTLKNCRLDCPVISCADGSTLAPTFYQNEPGLLPLVLKDVLSQRSKTKKRLEATKDALLAAVLDGRQLALKLVANSVYGFTGAILGQMPRLDISASVTYYGRLALLKVKGHVERVYTAEFIYTTILKKPIPQECVGRKTIVIGGDTDSIFVSFPVTCDRQGLQDSIAVARVAAADCTSMFNEPMELEYENTYQPMLVLAKKRYIAGKYVSGFEVLEDLPDDKWERGVQAKGVETVRRDVPKFTANLMKTIIREIFIRQNIDNAYKKLDIDLAKFCNKEISMKDMSISAQLGEELDYANPDSLAHVNVVRKMRTRNPGSEPRTGDRVSFVFVKSKTKKAAGKAEDVAYATEHNLELDLEYYFDHKIMKPVKKLFGSLDPHVNYKFESCRNIVMGKNRGYGSILADLKNMGAISDNAKVNDVTEPRKPSVVRAYQKQSNEESSKHSSDVNGLVAFMTGGQKRSNDETRRPSLSITSSAAKNKKAKRRKQNEPLVGMDLSSLFKASAAQ